MSKVLVVEDEADIRRLLEMRLSRLGHQVISTGSAAEAMTAVAEHGTPDVAVLDIVMRDVSGLELLDRMRRCPARSSVPWPRGTEPRADASAGPASDRDAGPALVQNRFSAGSAWAEITSP